MKFYGADEITSLLGVSRSKAYEIIRQLRKDLKLLGFLSPKAGKIQQSYFCERFMLDPAECDECLRNASTQKEAM